MTPTTATCVAAITSQQQQQRPPDCQVTELEQYTHRVSPNRYHIDKYKFESICNTVVFSHCVGYIKLIRITCTSFVVFVHFIIS